MAGALISPKSDLLIKNKNAAYQIKFGVPHFKELLRERCRAHIKAKRGDLFNRMRTIQTEEDKRIVVSEILHFAVRGLGSSESKNDTSDVMDTGVILKRVASGISEMQVGVESLDNEEQCLMAEYERLLARDLDLMEDQVICPLCEKGALRETGPQVLQCPACVTTIPSRISLEGLNQLIHSALSMHNVRCNDTAQFVIFSDESSSGLFLVCHTCCFLHQLV